PGAQRVAQALHSLPRRHPYGQPRRRNLRIRRAPGLPAHGGRGTLRQGRVDRPPARLHQVSRQPGAGKAFHRSLPLSAERKVRGEDRRDRRHRATSPTSGENPQRKSHLASAMTRNTTSVMSSYCLAPAAKESAACMIVERVLAAGRSAHPFNTAIKRSSPNSSSAGFSASLIPSVNATSTSPG